MTLPLTTQKYEFGKRNVTTPALISSRLWTAGDVWLDGQKACFYYDLRDVGASVEVNVATTGAFVFPCASAVTAAKGADAYYDTTNRTIVTAPGTSIILVGKFIIAKIDGVTTALVELNATGEQTERSVMSVRVRSTIAEVNAGKTLLPALPGYKYAIRDVKAIAVGGAAGAVTTVDVLATQSASSVKLVAFAQASLTQNTLLRAGASGAAILAGGVSFVANDANTAVTVGKTGSDVTTATHIDLIVDYVLEAA